MLVSNWNPCLRQIKQARPFRILNNKYVVALVIVEECRRIEGRIGGQSHIRVLHTHTAYSQYVIIYQHIFDEVATTIPCRTMFARLALCFDAMRTPMHFVLTIVCATQAWARMNQRAIAEQE